MATRSPEAATSSGLAATYYDGSAGTPGDRVPPGVLLHVKNTAASVLTVTIYTIGVVDGDLAVADRTFTVPITTGERFVRIPVLPAYVDPADGMVGIGWSTTGATTKFAVLS